MIVQPHADSLWLIRQMDHATLAGDLAQHWGNETFRHPEPFASVLLAAQRHDDGWQTWEAEPKVNPQTHRPYQFTALPIEEHLTFYLHGIDQVVQQDPYAGLLVNMHLTGLYQQRSGNDLGISTKHYHPEQQAVLRGYLERLEMQRQFLCQQISQTAALARWLDKNYLDTNYKLLQIYDRLSLFFCMAPVREMQLGPAPVDYQDQATMLSLHPIAERTLKIAPYPFDRSPLRVSVPIRVIPDHDYADDVALRVALGHAEMAQINFELQAC